MDTFSAILRGEASKGNRARVFDWDRAAKIIREEKPEEAAAGLGQDWELTGGDIYRDGKIIHQDDTYTYLASTWAIPELELDGRIIECWRWIDETEWNESTYWPQSAIDILSGEAE